MVQILGMTLAILMSSAEMLTKALLSGRQLSGDNRIKPVPGLVP